MCTDLEADPEKILSWFVMRWQIEATFQEVHRHLGFETQRQWSEMAIRRTIHRRSVGFVLAGRFVRVWGRMTQEAADVFGQVRRQAAWYHKSHPTFADALALVRKELWTQGAYRGSLADTETVKVPRAFMERLTDVLCYAA